MTSANASIEVKLLESLKGLDEDEKIDVLLFTGTDHKKVKALLMSQKQENQLDFNFLQLANCFVVHAPKRVILELAGSDEVIRIAANPGFTIY